MRYCLKQRLFTLADSFTINDHEGRAAFTVDGKLQLFRAQFTFRDIDGTELAQIKQKKRAALKPTYEIYEHGKLAALVEGVVLERMRPHATFNITVPNAHNLVASGDVWGLEYEVRRGEHIVSKVSKQGYTLLDTYDVQVMEKRDTVLMLAIAVVIDEVCHPGV